MSTWAALFLSKWGDKAKGRDASVKEEEGRGNQEEKIGLTVGPARPEGNPSIYTAARNQEKRGGRKEKCVQESAERVNLNAEAGEGGTNKKRGARGGGGGGICGGADLGAKRFKKGGTNRELMVSARGHVSGKARPNK